MSQSYTYSATNTYTEARARYVLGKIKDDFANIRYRGFQGMDWPTLEDWWEAIDFVVSKKALEKVELQFRWDGKEAGLAYVVCADGTIYIDQDSATHDFYNIPAHAKVSIVIRRDRHNKAVSEYLEKNGWGSGGTFLEGGTTSGGYSKDGFGAHITKTGQW